MNFKYKYLKYKKKYINLKINGGSKTNNKIIKTTFNEFDELLKLKDDIEKNLSKISEKIKLIRNKNTYGFNLKTTKDFLIYLKPFNLEDISLCKKSMASIEYKKLIEQKNYNKYDTYYLEKKFRIAINKKKEISESIKKKIYINELRKKKNKFGNITIGAGFCGTANWFFRKELGLLKEDDLCIAKNEGNWTENNYVFAQRHSTLDNAYYKWNAKDFIDEDEWEKNSFVKAPDYYKSQILNQDDMKMKILEGNVIKIEFINNKDIINEGYVYKLTLNYSYNNLKNGIWQIYCKSIDLCMGQGTATSICSMNMEKVFGDNINDGINKIIEFLSLQIKNIKGDNIPRLINANEYVLNDKYITSDKEIIIYGSGGTSNAAARKAILGIDDGKSVKSFKKKSVNDVRLFARKNFSSSGKGDLVTETLDYLNDKRRLYINHEIEKVTIDKDNKFNIKFKNDVEIYKADIFIYGIGQNEEGDNQMTGISSILPFEIKNNLRITDGMKSLECIKSNGNDPDYYELIDFVPSCLHFKESLFIHGASSITKLNLNKGLDKCNIAGFFSKNDYLFLPEDNKYPSTMPISLACMKLFYHKKYDNQNFLLNNINLNVDSIEIINKFFRNSTIPIINKIIKSTINIGSKLWNEKDKVLCIKLYSIIIDFLNRLKFISIKSENITFDLIKKNINENDKSILLQELDKKFSEGWIYRYVLIYFYKRQIDITNN